MKFLAVSDKVLPSLYDAHVKQRYPDLDLLIGCGDLPFYYLDFLVSALDTRMVYVRGNHDGGPQFQTDYGQISGVRGGEDIHARCVQECGLLFAGLEGSMRYKPNAPCMYTEREMSLQVMRLLPRLLLNRVRYGRMLDILVTHSPPFGIHDADDLPHTGFKIFRTLMRLTRPRYLLHGHIHLYRNNIQRITQFHQTTVINVYPSYLLELQASGADKVLGIHNCSQ